jgi:eukaryotic-like serine/threonine-protein kinase
MTATPEAARFGPYRVLRCLGRGSMGEVFLAVDDTTGAAVALKLIDLAATGTDAADRRRRFVAEAEPLRRLQHPDIVALHAAGEQGGRGWLAMELLTGTSLERYTRPARLLPESVVASIGARLALALQHAHDAGVVHRDVKPSNVIVDWARDQIKLTDFGLARLADGERTRTGLVLGSPAYMAPELLAGAAATPASDLYALGVLLFQLLAGRLPHDHASLGVLLRQVAREPAPELRSLRPGLPPALCAEVASLLSRQSARRPADARTAAARLQAAGRIG